MIKQKGHVIDYYSLVLLDGVWDLVKNMRRHQFCVLIFLLIRLDPEIPSFFLDQFHPQKCIHVSRKRGDRPPDITDIIMTWKL